MIGQYAYWLARLPGGLKGWRLGLLLMPLFGVLWSCGEGARCVRGLCRGCAIRKQADVWRGWFWTTLFAVIFVFAALLASAAWLAGPEAVRKWYHDPGAAGLLLLLVMALSALLRFTCFAGLGIPLNQLARQHEVIPTSSMKFRRQLGTLLVLGWVVPLAAFALWRGGAEIRMARVAGRLKADGRIADGRLWRRIAKVHGRDFDSLNSVSIVELKIAELPVRLPRAATVAGEKLPMAELHRKLRSDTLAAAADCEERFGRLGMYEKFSDEDVGLRVVLGDYYVLAGMLALDAGDDAELLRCLKRLCALDPGGDPTLFRETFLPLERLFDLAVGRGFWARLDEAEIREVAAAAASIGRGGEDAKRFLALCIGTVLDPPLSIRADLGAAGQAMVFEAPWFASGRADLVEYMEYFYHCAGVEFAERPPDPAGRYDLSWCVALSAGDARLSFADGVLWWHVRIVVWQRSVEIGAALELYRRRRGGYPGTLEELTPEFLAEVPLKPNDGKPFYYHPGPPATLSWNDRYPSVILALP